MIIIWDIFFKKKEYFFEYKNDGILSLMLFHIKSFQLKKQVNKMIRNLFLIITITISVFYVQLAFGDSVDDKLNGQKDKFQSTVEAKCKSKSKLI